MLVLSLLLAGCRSQVEIRPGTIVDIPLDPTTPPAVTQPVTEASSEAPAIPPAEPPVQKTTEPPAEKPTEKPTQPPTQAPTIPVMKNYRAAELDLAVAEAVNAFRARNGLQALSVLDPLVEAAGLRCGELPLRWDHTRPDGSPFTTALTDAGLAFTTATETILVTAAEPHPQTVVDKLAASETHRPELLQENGRYIGVAHLEIDGTTAINILIIG